MSKPLTVRIFKLWDWPRNFLRQTPGGKGIWRGVQYHVDQEGDCDYAVVHYVLNHTKRVQCPRQNVWLIAGEAPSEAWSSQHNKPKWAARVYGNDASRVGDAYRLAYSPLPWIVDKTYDELKVAAVPAKCHLLAWVVSTLDVTAVHRERLSFRDKIRDMPELQLYGKGLRFIEDKWDALAPAKYAIAYENYSNSHYWTEKVMDAFLSWTMPIYWGCTHLEDYFPRESFIRLDPNWSDPIRELRQIVQSGTWERNLDAIAEARRRVLDKYNFFEFVAREVMMQERISPAARFKRQKVTLRNHTLPWYLALKNDMLGAVKRYVRL